MKNKIIVYNFIDIEIGQISATKAKRAIRLGVASKKTSKSNAIKTYASTMAEFLRLYSEKYKKKSIKTLCWECGKEIEVKDLNSRALCEVCDKKHNKEINEAKEKYQKLKAILYYEKAILILSKQEKPLDLRKYREAALAVKEYIVENYNKFDSSYEIAAAIELIKNKISLKVQPNINSYKADFILKDEKIVLEIDGERHKYKKEFDFKRDIEIRKELGEEWEIIRIPTNYIDTNISRLYEAIMELKIYKKSIRQKNNGLLPEWYSQREKNGFYSMVK